MTIIKKIVFILMLVCFSILILYGVEKLRESRWPFIDLESLEPLNVSEVHRTADPNSLRFAVATIVSAETTFSTYRNLVRKIGVMVGRKEIFIVKQNRFNPPVQALKSLTNEKKLGEIYYVVINCFWNRNEQYYLDSDWRGTKELDGGTLFTQFSHFIDIFYYLFGNIDDIQGNLKNSNHDELIEFEDTGCFNFRFTTGALGSLNYTTSAYHQNMEGSITVFAENGTIKIGGKYLNTIDYQITDNFDVQGLPESNRANNYGYYEGSMSNHDKVIHNVIQTLKGNESIMANAQEGKKVVEIIERMYLSVK